MTQGRETTSLRLLGATVERVGRLAVLLQVALIPLVASPYHQSPHVLPKHTLAVWIALVMLLPLLVARALLRRGESRLRRSRCAS